MKTTVVHCKRDAFDVYIGRPSKWGNPYHIGRDGTRAEVIDKYFFYANKQFSESELMELVGKRLGCFCAPKPCHGDVLVKLIGRILHYQQVMDPPEEE